MAQVAGSFLAAGDSAAMPPAAYIPWANDGMPQEGRVFDPGNPRKTCAWEVKVQLMLL